MMLMNSEKLLAGSAMKDVAIPPRPTVVMALILILCVEFPILAGWRWWRAYPLSTRVVSNSAH
jgi:hypothetical protein